VLRYKNFFERLGVNLPAIKYYAGCGGYFVGIFTRATERELDYLSN
jgi:hypothetical protein